MPQQLIQRRNQCVGVALAGQGATGIAKYLVFAPKDLAPHRAAQQPQHGTDALQPLSAGVDHLIPAHAPRAAKVAENPCNLMARDSANIMVYGLTHLEFECHGQPPDTQSYRAMRPNPTK